MLRTILVAGVSSAVAGVVGFRAGARAGFDAGVRDYLENDAEQLETVAAQRSKFDYEPGDDEEESPPEQNGSQGFQ